MAPMKLDRFDSFNESVNPNVVKLNKDSQYTLTPNTDGLVKLSYIGSDEYTLSINDDKQTCELTTPKGESIQMSYNEIATNKERIISLEPTPLDGKLLYKWICRMASVVEWSSSHYVSDWHTFETKNNLPKPLGSASSESDSDLKYTFNTTNGMFELEILKDQSTFKLTGPDMLFPIIGTLNDLFQNSEYYMSLAFGNEVYNWIRFCFSTELMKHQGTPEDYLKKIRFEHITVNGNTYILETNVETNECLLYLPPRRISCSLENIYEQLPELPALESGEVNREIQERIERIGTVMPSTPYEIRFTLKNRIP